MFNSKLIRKNRQSNGTFSGSESHERLTAESHAVATDLIAAADNLETGFSSVDHFDNQIDVLTKHREQMLRSIENGTGYDVMTAESAKLSLDYISREMGYDSDEMFIVDPSDFDAESTRVSYTRMSAESIMEKLKEAFIAVKDAIVNMFKAVINWVKKLFSSDNIASLKKSVESLKEKANDAKGDPDKSKFDDKTLARTFTPTPSRDEVKVSDIASLIAGHSTFPEETKASVSKLYTAVKEVETNSGSKDPQSSKIQDKITDAFKSIIEIFKDNKLSGDADKNTVAELLSVKKDAAVKSSSSIRLCNKRQVNFVLVRGEKDNVTEMHLSTSESLGKDPSSIVAGTANEVKTICSDMLLLIKGIEKKGDLDKSISEIEKSATAAMNKAIDSLDDSAPNAEQVKKDAKITRDNSKSISKTTQKMITIVYGDSVKAIKGGLTWGNKSLSNLKK